jgi:hypothetical protein
MDNVFLFATGALAVGFLVSLALKQIALRTTSGDAAAKDETAAAAVTGHPQGEAAVDATAAPH